MTNLEKANAIWEEAFGVEEKFNEPICPYQIEHMCVTCSLKQNGVCKAEQWWEQTYNGKIELECEIDWNKVPVDTLIIVGGGEKEFKRYFARYENGKVYAWSDGRTSVTADDPNDVSYWKFARVAE